MYLTGVSYITYFHIIHMMVYAWSVCFHRFFRICHGIIKKSRYNFDCKLKILHNPFSTLNSFFLFCSLVGLFILVNANKLFLTVVKLSGGIVISLLTSSLYLKTVLIIIMYVFYMSEVTKSIIALLQACCPRGFQQLLQE